MHDDEGSRGEQKDSRVGTEGATLAQESAHCTGGKLTDGSEVLLSARSDCHPNLIFSPYRMKPDGSLVA